MRSCRRNCKPLRRFYRGRQHRCGHEHDFQLRRRIRAAAFSKERNAVQRNRHDSTQCTADLQISGHSAENSKHLSAAVSGRAGGTEPGKSGQKRRDMRPSEKKAIAPNSALPPNGLQSAKSPVTEGILDKAKELFAGSGISAANVDPAENSNPAVHRSDFDADIGALCESCARWTKRGRKPVPAAFSQLVLEKTPKRPPSVRQSSRSRRNVRHRRRAECKPPPSRRSLRKSSPRSFKQRQLVLARDTP